MHHDDKIDPKSGDIKKPEIIPCCNSTKGGVDIVDQMAGEYDTSRNSRRWPLTVFLYVVERFHYKCVHTLLS